MALWFFDPFGVALVQLTNTFVGGVVSVALIISSLIVYLAEVFEKKKLLAPFLAPLTVIVLAVVVVAPSLFVSQLLYVAFPYLVLGTAFFLYEMQTIMAEETVGVTLWEKTTYETKAKKLPYFDDESIISQKVFGGNLRICKGDAILTICKFIQDGRALAKKIIESGEYGIWISADRPFTMVQHDFEGYKGKIYCVDCFTNVYGLGEFPEVDGRASCYTLSPTTIRQLHIVLREIRRRIVSEVYFGKDWFELDRAKKQKVDEHLGSKEAVLEREKNVKIIYDSISSLGAIFDLEPLLTFLIHDTTVDMTIGRNTLLLAKDGVLAPNVVSRLESICEHILGVQVSNGKIFLDIKRSCGRVKPSGRFAIDI